MKKLYLLAPLVAMIVFTVVYASHRSGLREREAAKREEAAAALKIRNEKEQEERRAAMAEAIAQAERRKNERDAKAAKDTAEKETRQLAVDARDKAYRDQEKFSRQIERLRKEIEAEQAELAKLAAARKKAEAERAFLVEFVTKSQANVQALQALLTKLNTPPPAAPAAVK